MGSATGLSRETLPDRGGIWSSNCRRCSCCVHWHRVRNGPFRRRTKPPDLDVRSNCGGRVRRRTFAGRSDPPISQSTHSCGKHRWASCCWAHHHLGRRVYVHVVPRHPVRRNPDRVGHSSSCTSREPVEQSVVAGPESDLRSRQDLGRRRPVGAHRNRSKRRTRRTRVHV